ncbi:hypothetical protein BUM88_15795 [Acinetobacter calcoaceticus]|uniref:hypothetical protein n=1 Tax=Acinetobacter calcoaceticus TaxID=471 RepID=UPI0009ADC25D|nr:hypothetical protein [Acinetobacter calcoaceticus]AQZ82951.1 hypothetical protein BUM88_15795 [Acinetobacter calcoaceticus]
MPKSKKPRKKFRTKKNQKQFTQGDIHIREYYQVAFNFFIRKYLENIKIEVLELRYKLRSEFYQEHTIIPKSGDYAFNFLKQYLFHLEAILKEIISSHSPSFWIHLYRRVGVDVLHLIVKDNESVSPMTINIVRNFMEIAFLKFGDLDKVDLCLTKDLHYNEILDGLFYESHKDIGLSDQKIEEYWNQYSKKSEIILKDYKKIDHKNIYFLEGIAYEYWKTTANMRSIAKGGELSTCENFFWRESRTDDLNKLISSYDRRISINFKYLPTAKGLITYDEIGSNNNLFYTVYNDNFVRFSQICSDKKFSNVITNFYPQYVNIDNFVDSHKVLEKPFEKKKKYSIKFCLSFFKALSDVFIEHRGLDKSTNSQDLDKNIKLFSILQRSYTILPLNKDALFTELKTKILHFGFSSTEIDEVLPKILDEYILDKEQQSIMSIWSFGPRPLIIENTFGSLIDVAGFSTILRNLFFGVRENQTERGVELERIARNFVEKNGYTLLKDRILKNNSQQEREADLVIRVNNSIILCDCRSIESPVDLFLGKPSTQIARNSLIQDKFEQIESLKKFIIEHPIGKNYDYSYADKIFSIAILPDPEWIPRLNKDYWIDLDQDLPKIMSIQELFNFLDKLTLSSA